MNDLRKTDDDAPRASGQALRRVVVEEFEERFEEILADAENGTVVLRDGAPFMRCVPIKRTEP